MTRNETTYSQTVFIDGDFLDQIAALDAHLLFRQQLVDDYIRQMFPFTEEISKKYFSQFKMFQTIQIDFTITGMRSALCISRARY